MCVELVRDVRDVLVGLLEQYRIEGAAHGRDKLRRPMARSTRVPRATVGEFAWRRSLTGFDKGPSNPGFGFPNLVSGCNHSRGLGIRSYPVNMACVGSSGVGVPSVPVLACGGGP